MTDALSRLRRGWEFCHNHSKLAFIMPPNLRHVAMKVLDNLGIIKRSEEGDHITFLFGDATYTIKTRISFSNDGEILIYSWPEFTIPAECRKKAIEYLNRRNFSSKIGCLEMDVNVILLASIFVMLELILIAYLFLYRMAKCGIGPVCDTVKQLLWKVF